LGHFLTTIHMQIQAARAVMSNDPTRAQEILTKAQNLTQETLADVRRSVAALRVSPGETRPIEESIQELLDGCKGSALATDLKLSGKIRPIPPTQQLTLYRAVQEGINNTLKHAHASHIWVHLDYTQPNAVRLVFSDDGQGTPELKHGFGLMGLQERMHLLQGELRISSTPGGGFTFEITVPT
jgi:signal transduction histidine kinase